MTIASAEAFLLADARYFESPVLWRQGGAQMLDEDARSALAAAGFARRSLGVWTVWDAPEEELPNAGWKIHLSATAGSAREVVAAAAAYCAEEGVSFKHLMTVSAARAFNLKNAPRSSSGKVVTIYPRAEDLVRHADALAERLQGFVGPRILTDLPWGDGIVGVRYGAFRNVVRVDATGRIRNYFRTEAGGLIQDERNPWFEAPDDIEVPPAPPARASAGPSPLEAYRDYSALHFSNAGGVYRAWDPAGERWVVIKEARPHVEPGAEGESADAHLRRELTALAALRGTRGVPPLISSFEDEGHFFVVTELVEGESLQRWLALHHPLVLSAFPSARDVDDYVTRAARLFERLERLSDAVQARGWVHDDVHPGNILVDDDDEVALVDWECASEIEAAARWAPLRRQGFGSALVAPRERERQALDRIALWMLAPYQHVVALAPELEHVHIAYARRRYGALPERLERALVRLSTAQSAERGGPVPVDRSLTRRLATGVRASMQPARADRLFPGSLEQFSLGGATYAFGAAGVVHVLERHGGGAPREAVAWLESEWVKGVPASGLMDGEAGVALALADTGTMVLPTRDVGPAHPDDITYATGAAGRALVALELGDRTGTAEATARAFAAAEQIAAMLSHDDVLPSAGLLYGWSGPALLFLHLFRRTGDSVWLDRCVRAVDIDVSRCVDRGAGGLQALGEGSRAIAYLAHGSSGIGLVIDELLDVVDLPELRARLEPITAACSPEVVVQPALFSGRAGLALALHRLVPRLTGAPAERARTALSRHLDCLPLTLIDSGADDVRVPGDHCLRQSMDFANGAAGLIAVLGEIASGTPAVPFLSRRTVPRDRGAGVPAFLVPSGIADSSR
ncbi:class III lanthionine synthetase LanKC [Microbacterium sp. SLBN-146]|uniref:class III lanthionine synthetase LanKC n=1 Tax=Microbacterium sp. SLBN-146 TaxID=2768457 RepID=UPI00115075C6|nr:class III lanthionine synthetase LanKC [Microbacterium sp. SLBN-146]TQJ31122.1 protein kinase-like protein [Microbacterium sp. SLBN-146]